MRSIRLNLNGRRKIRRPKADPGPLHYFLLKCNYLRSIIDQSTSVTIKPTKPPSPNVEIRPVMLSTTLDIPNIVVPNTTSTKTASAAKPIKGW